MSDEAIWVFFDMSWSRKAQNQTMTGQKIAIDSDKFRGMNLSHFKWATGTLKIENLAVTVILAKSRAVSDKIRKRLRT